MNASDNFYDEIPGFTPFEKFAVTSYYRKVPDDWYVSIADVKNSTGNIKAGKYKDVNAVGAASIAAVINAIKPTSIPFVFGGDGASFCYPQSCKVKIESALLAAKKLAEKEFSMSLIIGSLPVRLLREKGKEVFVAKYQPSIHYQQAMFSGNGITLAEELIKKTDIYSINESIVKPEGNFEGFECRWNEIPSPKEETVSLLIQALVDTADSEMVYMEINDKIFEIYGKENEHHPIIKENLSISFSFKKLLTETRIRTRIKNNFKRLKYLIKLIFKNAAGKWMMARKFKTKNTDWGKYKERLISNTDYRKFDDTLRMVISGTQDQRKQLIDFLDLLKQQSKIVYGLHISTSSLLTCLVQDYENEHIHFLDGSDGGYAFAAIQLKKQLQEVRLKNIL